MRTNPQTAFARGSDPNFTPGVHGFLGMIDALIAFPKPLIIAVNGLGLGIGATILGFADLAFMSTTARLKCPFTSLGVSPEAASSFTFPATATTTQNEISRVVTENGGGDATIQFTSPGRMAISEPTLSRCMISPSNR